MPVSCDDMRPSACSACPECCTLLSDLRSFHIVLNRYVFTSSSGGSRHPAEQSVHHLNQHSGIHPRALDSPSFHRSKNRCSSPVRIFERSGIFIQPTLPDRISRLWSCPACRRGAYTRMCSPRTSRSTAPSTVFCFSPKHPGLYDFVCYLRHKRIDSGKLRKISRLERLARLIGECHGLDKLCKHLVVGSFLGQKFLGFSRWV